MLLISFFSAARNIVHIIYRIFLLLIGKFGAVPDKRNNPGWKNEINQIKQKQEKLIGYFAVRITTGSPSAILNVSTVASYFHKLMELIIEAEESYFGCV